MSDDGYSDRPEPNRRGYEPRRFKSLVAQPHREAQRHRLRVDDQTCHEAPLVRVTQWLVVATIALAVAGFLGFAAAILQWRTLTSTDEKAGANLTALKDQLSVMRDEFAAANRPWVSLDSKPEISGSLLFDKDNGNINLSAHFDLFNSGKTPAVFVYPSVRAILMPAGHQLFRIVEKAREFCDKERSAPFPATELELGVLAPPGKRTSPPSHFGISITADDILVNKETTNGRDTIFPFIAGCINYQFTFGEKRRHQSGFIYQLLAQNTFIFLDGGNIPADKLFLVEQDGAWAD